MPRIVAHRSACRLSRAVRAARPASRSQSAGEWPPHAPSSPGRGAGSLCLMCTASIDPGRRTVVCNSAIPFVENVQRGRAARRLGPPGGPMRARRPRAQSFGVVASRPRDRAVNPSPIARALHPCYGHQSIADIQTYTHSQRHRNTAAYLPPDPSQRNPCATTICNSPSVGRTSEC